MSKKPEIPWPFFEMVNYDEDEGDNERSTLLNPEQGNVDSNKKLVVIWLVCPRRNFEQ